LTILRVVAESRICAAIVAGVAEGDPALISAANPATCGAEPEVPENTAVAEELV